MAEGKSNRRQMKVNVNHPSFISFLENISENILSSIKIEEYFKLSEEKKRVVSLTVLNLLKNSAKVRTNLSDEDLKSFIAVLCKKNEEYENYEFAAVLQDVIINYDSVTKMKPKGVPPRKKKTINPSPSGEE